MKPCGKDNEDVVRGLLEKGVRMSEIGTQIRAVTHLDVNDDDITSTITALDQVVNG